MSVPAKYRNPFSYYYYSEHDDGLSRWLKSISLLSAIIALLIFVDYFLPLKESTYKIQDVMVRTGFEDISYEDYLKADYRTGDEEFWIILDREEVAVSENDLKGQMKGDDFFIYKTTIFGLHVKFKNASSEEIFYPYLNIYGFLLLFPIAFLLIFILTIVYRKKQDLLISLGVINIIMLVGFGFLMLFY